MAQQPQLTADQNASLILTKMLAKPRKPYDSKEKKPTFVAATACTPSADYTRAYERWTERIAKLPGTTLAATFTVDGRMAVGIGAGNILESSITMNRLWGMPLIPGSALKGLASHYAASVLSGTVSRDQQVELFGTTEWAGCITWLDAWYVPKPLTASPFRLDVVTPHHQSYYQGPVNPPWDFEDPIPNNFISVRGTFLVAVQAPDQDWAYAALNVLERALDEWGIGAKTNAGYGRLAFKEWLGALEGQGIIPSPGYRLLHDIAPAARGGARVLAEQWTQRWSNLADDDPLRQTIAERIVIRLKEQPDDYQQLNREPPPWFEALFYFLMDRDIDPDTLR